MDKKGGEKGTLARYLLPAEHLLPMCYLLALLSLYRPKNVKGIESIALLQTG